MLYNMQINLVSGTVILKFDFLKESRMNRISLNNNIAGFGYNLHKRFGDSFLMCIFVSGPAFIFKAL